jgi:tripartite-type tricarboxylate transporter receptor subunit TctC
MLHRRTIALALPLTLAGVALSGTASAQSYPSRPVTLVISFAAGGVADVVARLVAQRLTEKGAGTFVVENRGGAGGNIATRYVASQPADGYTVLATTTAIAVNATAHKSRGYQMEDLRAITISAIAPDVIAVHPNSPYKTLKDLIEANKGKQLSYGTSGFGTGPYIGATYFFKEIAKLDVAHIPFTGGGPAVQAAMGNHVPVIVVGVPTAQGQISQGQLRGLAITADTRNAAMPQVPTLAETGYQLVKSATWVGFYVPAKTPDAVVEKLNAEINDAVKSDAAQSKLKAIGFDPMTMTTRQAADYTRAEVALWERMSKAIGFSID